MRRFDARRRRRQENRTWVERGGLVWIAAAIVVVWLALRYFGVL
jgi:hypothetical protein